MFDVTVTGITAAIKSLTAFTETLQDKMNLVVDRLMQEGFNVASAAFSTAYYAGTNDVVVNPPEWEGDVMVLRADGKAVAFIEFGTGKFYPEYPDSGAYDRLALSKRGEYGKGKGKTPPWRYIGDPGNAGVILKHKSDGTDVVQTYGNPPARGMFNAAEAVSNRQRAIEIAKEVFK